MSTTRLQEVLVCFGKKKQADIASASAAADMWRFRSRRCTQTIGLRYHPSEDTQTWIGASF